MQDSESDPLSSRVPPQLPVSATGADSDSDGLGVPPRGPLAGRGGQIQVMNHEYTRRPPLRPPSSSLALRGAAANFASEWQWRALALALASGLLKVD